jgi:hypothetical protein
MSPSPDSPPPSRAPLEPPLEVEPKPWTERVLRAFKEEIGGLNFRLILAHVVMHLLPSHHFPRLRTTIYRLAGFRIGPR